MKIIPLETRPVEVQQDVLELAREALAMAEAGELVAIGLVLVRKDRQIWTRGSKNDHHSSLIAGTAYLQHDLISGSGQ